MNYIIGEHYYTASKYKNGFYTLDYSKFLSSEEIDALEKSGVYQTAMSLNSNPSETEIKTLFPVNIAFYKLAAPSNRYVYLHSEYTGKANHTPDRYGNYFSHSVILKENEPAFPAYFIFNQFPFKKEFNIEEDEIYQPQLGDRNINIDTDLIRVISQAFNHFCSFLGEEDNIYIFANIIDLITDGILNTRGNNITICAEKNKVKEIILSVNFFLPQNIANKISFATYINNPSRYPFQITGIIPECSISSLDSKYYTLINAIINFKYEPRHPYTKFLIELIKEKSEKSFEQWKNLNKSILNEFEISEPTTRLNSPIIYYDFIKNPIEKTILDFNGLITANLPLEKEVELKRITAERNPQLYLDFVIEELKRKAGNIYTFREKKVLFQKIILEHFDNKNHFRQNFLPYITDVFRELCGNDKSEASLFVLNTVKCSDIEPGTWLRQMMQQADEYFASEVLDVETKLEQVRNLNEKYNLNIFQEIIPNIMKVKLFDDIRKSAEKDDFIRNIRNFKAFLNTASDKEKTELLLLGFNHDAYFFKTKFSNFDAYIKIIKEYLPEQQPQFWYRFFEYNRNFNKENDTKKHSLYYLKKKFVSMIFLNQYENHEIFSKLRLDDEYTMRWIEEDIREHTTREAVLQTFAEAFKTHPSIRYSSFWDFIRKKY